MSRLRPHMGLPRSRLAIVGAAAYLVLVVTAAGALVLRVTAAGPLFPAYGREIAASTRTCSVAKIQGTAISGRECKDWGTTGPVNLVIVVTRRDPFDELVHHSDSGWRAAQGNWLVQQGHTDESGKGCDSGWRDSTRQAEQRVDKVTRRHIKFIYMACTQDDGTTIVFADAHTDRYDLKRCGGDSLLDLDNALDAAVASFRAIRGAHVDVRTDGPVGDVPNGCGGSVRNDGRVAYISLDD